MSGLEAIGLVVLGLLMLSVVGIYRWATRPGGVWRESWRHQGTYLDYCRHHRKHDYEWKYLAHQRAMIMWIRAPLITEFLRRARSLRDHLAEQGRKPREALAIWGTLMEEAPASAVSAHVTPEGMVRAYDQIVAADEASKALNRLTAAKEQP